MKQKIIKVGNSAAVTIPRKTLDEKGLKIGDTADVEIRAAFEANEEIHFLTQKIIKQYKPALEELARK